MSLIVYAPVLKEYSIKGLSSVSTSRSFCLHDAIERRMPSARSMEATVSSDIWWVQFSEGVSSTPRYL